MSDISIYVDIIQNVCMCISIHVTDVYSSVYIYAYNIYHLRGVVVLYVSYREKVSLPSPCQKGYCVKLLTKMLCKRVEHDRMEQNAVRNDVCVLCLCLRWLQM